MTNQNTQKIAEFLEASQTGKQIVSLYNEFADAPVKKFSDKATAISRTAKLLDESGMTVSKGSIRPIEEPASEPAKKARTEYNEEATIDVTIGHNPKRKGSASFDRFELYKKHTTVKSYLDACVALDGKNAKPRSKYLADLRWDEQRQFITVWTTELLAEVGDQ